MGSSNGDNSPNFSFCDDDGRVVIKGYSNQSQFFVGDTVYLIVHRADITGREGPYVIASVPAAGRYTLCLENGQPAKNGMEIEGENLELADG